MAELSRELRSILDRVHRRGDSFVIEQAREAFAALEPVAVAATWSTPAAALHAAPRPGAAFCADLVEIQRHQPDVPRDEWSS